MTQGERGPADAAGAKADASSGPKMHRSKGVLERNMPRWFRGRAFKPWDDLFAFLGLDQGVKDDAELAKDWKELKEKGDEASPKGLQRLVRHYNKKRRFKKEELAPPWLFVEGTTRALPADDAWTIDAAIELDRSHEKDKAERPKDAPAPETGPALQDGGSYLAPPAQDKQWQEALRRLPPKVRLLCDGRGKDPAELNARRRLAIKLNEIDRDLSRERGLTQDQRRSLVEWAGETKAKDTAAVKAEHKRREDALAGWVDEQVKRALAKTPALDAGTVAELKPRLGREHPRAPDDARLEVLVRGAIAASNPKRRAEWAKKVIDDWNASRGSMFERVRDPRIIERLIQWLVNRDEEDTPTDGEVYDQIEKLGAGSAVAASKKRRPEGPRRPKEPERRTKHPNEEEPEVKPAKGPKGQKGAAKPAEAATAQPAEAAPAAADATPPAPPAPPPTA